MAVNRTELPNGLVIITKPVKTNSIVSVVVSLRMGSLYEDDRNAGLCTLLQDTLQKGTETRTSEQIALELESMGTRLSTTSNREYGTVEIQSTSENLYKSLDIFYDLLQNAIFPEKEIDLQKRLQIQDILTRYDVPLYRAIDLMVDAHYGKHPFHKPRMGYPETIRKLSRDEVMKMYKETFVPNNMVISVVGNFDEKQIINNITDNLGSLLKSEETATVSYEEEDYHSRSAPVEKIETRETAANWFSIGWSAPTLNDKDYYAMEVLDAITGGSMNSRLFIAIREKRGLAYQVSSFYNARVESGIYVTYIGTKSSTYNEAKKVLIDEVRQMGIKEPLSEEIKLARNFLQGMNIMSQESNSGQASQYAYYELLDLGYDFVNRYNENINKITASDILRVGRKYLIIENYALGGVLAK
ncbi:MAG TPA: insulinase family protein, partial [bacterium]|nr:insulinase family protein [bacterium]